MVESYTTVAALSNWARQFLNPEISQGSVATQLGCGEMFNNVFVTNLLLSLPVKEFLSLVSIWQSYAQKSSVLLFSSHYTMSLGLYDENYNLKNIMSHIIACTKQQFTLWINAYPSMQCLHWCASICGNQTHWKQRHCSHYVEICAIMHSVNGAAVFNQKC